MSDGYDDPFYYARNDPAMAAAYVAQSSVRIAVALEKIADALDTIIESGQPWHLLTIKDEGDDK